MTDLSEEEAAEKAKDRLVDINSRLYDRAAAYTNLILLGGYAGAFTIWNFTRLQLPAKATIASALLLGISLAVFVFFEVFKMTQGAIHFLRVRALLASATSSNDFLLKWRQAEIQSASSNLLQVRMWAACLFICVISALLAIVLLFYNFFAFLTGLPLWPN